MELFLRGCHPYEVSLYLLISNSIREVKILAVSHNAIVAVKSTLR